MKSETFNIVLEAWHNAELNRVYEGQYGLGEQMKKKAVERLAKRKEEYEREFEKEK